MNLKLDEEVKDKLLEWDRQNDPKAPLSAKQWAGIEALEDFDGARMLPVGLPAGENKLFLPCNMPEDSSREINNLPSAFNKLIASEKPISNTLEFYGWYSEIEEEISQQEDDAYWNFLCHLEMQWKQCQDLNQELSEALSNLDSLNQYYIAVSNKTNALHEACEHSLVQQTKLVNAAESISNKLTYFVEVDKIYQKLGSPTLSVQSEAFIPLLTNLDECIEYMKANSHFKESRVYLTRYQHCLSKALGLIRTYVNTALENTTQQVLQKKEAQGQSSNEDAFTLFYGKFRTNSQKIKSLMEQVEERLDISSEYSQLIADCHQSYFNQRQILLAPSVTSAVQELVNNHNKDFCLLVRNGCALLLHVCEDEHKLFFQFFSKPSLQLDKYLEGLCSYLYDSLRPLLIQMYHLETLSEVCSILKIEMLEEHVRHSSLQLAAFASVVTQLLQDVQERLVYRTHIYIRTDIIGYKPAPGDLAYPEKLEMMKSIAESIQQQQSLSRTSSRRSSVTSMVSVTSQEVSMFTNSELSYPDHGGQSRHSGISPADLHGMWYPTVRRTLVCLSKLYRCIDKTIFQGLSQEALSMCIESLTDAGQQIGKNKTPLDGELFQIKHLLILREQITPFQVEFSIRETALDFSKVKSAAATLYEKKSQLFSLSSNNSLLEFIVQGTPQVTESFVDSKREVDKKLKLVCEQFISHSSDMLVGPMKAFLQKVDVISKLQEKDPNSKVALANQPFSNAKMVAEVVTETNKLLKAKLPVVDSKMALYLSNKETEHILFRPVQTKILNTYQQFIQVVRANYSEEEQLIIAYPNVEQVSLMISSILST